MPIDFNRPDDSVKQDFEKADYLKLIKGDNIICVLPHWGEDKSQYPFYAFKVHFMKNLENKDVSFACPKDLEGQCVLCDKAWELRNSQNPEDQKLSQSLYARKHFLFNVVDANFNVKTIDVGVKAKEEIIAEMKEDQKQGHDPLDPNSSLQIKITKTGAFFDTEYRARSVGRIKLPESVRGAKLTDLSKVKPYFSNDELKLVLAGNYDPKGWAEQRKKKEQEAATQSNKEETQQTSTNPAQHANVNTSHVVGKSKLSAAEALRKINSGQL